MSCLLLPCKCESPFQDKEYGKGIRVHNLNSDKKSASCTVCEGSAKYAKRNSKSTPATTNRSSKTVK